MTETKATSAVSDAKLKEMLGGLEDVTPGFPKWVWLIGNEIIYTADPSDGVRTHALVRREHASNAVMAHIARCDPETIRYLVQAELDRRASGQVEATHRHKKRGTEYVLIGTGKMQAEKWYRRHGVETAVDVDMAEVAIYRSVADGSLWVRPLEEFEDGRFVALTTRSGEAGERPTDWKALGLDVVEYRSVPARSGEVGE